MQTHRRALALSIIVVLVFSFPGFSEEAAAPSPNEGVQGVTAAADSYAAELLANPPDDLSKGEIALAFGWMYLFNMLGQTDLAKADEYLQTALADGLVEAGVVLGAMHLGRPEYGGGPKDLDKALAYYEKAADGGSVDALRMLGILYSNGEEGVPADAEKGRAYLRAAAARGSETAIQLLEPLVREAAEWESAHPGQKADFPSTAEQLVDPELTAEAKRRADRLADATSKVFGLMERRLAELDKEIQAGAMAGAAAAPDGQAGMWKKLEKAIDDSAKAIIAEQPDAKSAGEAALVIGVFHYMGLFHGVDRARAKEYMEMALERGVPEARVTLGELYLGFAADPADGIARDVPKALGYLDAAAAAGNVDAQRLLGIVYAEGTDGVDRDAERSEKYLLEAARQGDPDALERLQPVFEKAAAWERDHPGEKSPLPTGAEAAVDPALAEAARKRSEELSKMAEMVNAEISKRSLAAMQKK